MITEERKLTWQQEAAINHRGSSLLVSSAAGSGKTMVLVERLLSYIDEGCNINQFLVITYTRAAATELRERIYDRLRQRLKTSPRNAHLRRQIMLCRGADIDTIHTFCASLLREFSYSAELPPDFRVADENESQLIRKEVIEDVFNRTYETDSDEDGLNLLIETTSSGQNDRAMIDIVSNIYEKVRSIPYYDKWIYEQIENANPDDDCEIANTIYGQHIIGTLERRIAHCYEIMIAIKEEIEKNEDLKSRYSESVEATISSIETLKKALQNGWDEAVEHANVEFPAPKAISGYDELKAARSWCRDEMRKIAKYLENSSSDHISDMKIIAPAIGKLLKIVLDFDNAYREEKRKRGVVDFSDLEHITMSMLHDKESGKKTSIAASITKRFKEILVDEYQDVNEVQEIIFNALSDNGNNIFMVGDVKQSIYRFRLAEPAIFLRKYNEYEELSVKEDEKGLKNRENEQESSEKVQKTIENEKSIKELEENKKDKTPKKINLSENFRSDAGILEAVNHVFKNIMSKQLGEMEYTDAEALIPGRTDEVRQVRKSGVADENQNSISEARTGSHEHNDEIRDETENIKSSTEMIRQVPFELDVLSTESDEEVGIKAADIEAEHVAKRIRELLDMKYMVKDKNGEYRELKYSDIAILSRSLKKLSWRYKKALLKYNIPVNISGSDDYFNTVEIQTAISLLSVIDNPIQDIALASVLCSPVFGFTSDEMAEIRAIDRTVSYYDALKRSQEPDAVSPETAEKSREFIEKIEQLRNLSYDMPTDKFIWTIYDRTELLSIMTALCGGEKRRENLITLAEYAKNYEKCGYKGLFSFLAYLNALQERDAEISNIISDKPGSGVQTDAVKLMSIHKSKGLEFPIVFLVHTTKKHNLTDINKSFVFHKSMGVGGMITDLKKRIRYTTLARMAISDKLRQETLSEELRILYVAMTRAREKLIITAGFNNAQNSCKKIKNLAFKNEKYSPEALMSLSSIGEWLLASVNNIGNEVLKVNFVDIPKHTENSEDMQVTDKFAVSTISDTREPATCNDGDLINDFKQEQETFCDSDMHRHSNAEEGNLKSGKITSGKKPEPKISVSDTDSEADKIISNITEHGKINSNIAEQKKTASDRPMIKNPEEHIKSLIEYTYNYNEAVNLPSKITVTGLKSIEDPEAENMKWSENVDDILSSNIKIPRFVKLEAAKTSAERGTIIHTVMQHINYNKCSTERDIEEQVQRIVKAGYLGNEEGLLVLDYAEKIKKLFNSELGMRMKEAAVHREFKFSLLTPAERYFPGGGDDEILIQGIIDCYFEENGQLVVVDFKTDRVFGQKTEKSIKKYTLQLEAYSEALERITGKKVRERIIYFFETGLAVSV